MPFRAPRSWDSAVYWALGVAGGAEGRDELGAIGMVPIRDGRIRLAEAFRARMGGPEAPSGAVAGGAMAAPGLAGALADVGRRMEEGVLLVHGAGRSVPALRDAHRRAGVRWPSPPVVDTARLLHRLSRRDRPRSPELPREGPPSLAAARAAHGLPPYDALDALADAIATAELFLVLRHALGARTLRDLR